MTPANVSVEPTGYPTPWVASNEQRLSSSGCGTGADIEPRCSELPQRTSGYGIRRCEAATAMVTQDAVTPLVTHQGECNRVTEREIIEVSAVMVSAVRSGVRTETVAQRRAYRHGRQLLEASCGKA